MIHDHDKPKSVKRKRNMVFETVKVQVAPLLFHSLGSSQMLWSFEQKQINVDLHIVGGFNPI